jgi:hypothetical protein
MPIKSGIKFEDPPAEHRGRYDWAAIAADLRSRPGEWALIFERDKTTYANAFQLGLKDLPRDEFEARTSNTVPAVTKAEADELGIEPRPRLCSLWLRYNPKKESA